MTRTTVKWTLLVAANAIILGVLSLYGSTAAAPQDPQGARQPFGNAVEQRENMIRELREIKTLLREQNTLLRAATAKETTDGRGQR